MNRFNNRIGLAAGIAMLSLLVPTQAFAQPKAALVQDQDEPGRQPYQAHIVGPPNFATPAIPAGKRLVVQHIAIWLFGSGPNTVLIFIQGATSAPSDPIFSYVYTQSPVSANEQHLSAPLTAYVDAGKHLSFLNSTPVALARAVVTGYLIDCSPTTCAPVAP